MEASTGVGMLRRDAMRYIGLFAMTALALMTALLMATRQITALSKVERFMAMVRNDVGACLKRGPTPCATLSSLCPLG